MDVAIAGAGLAGRLLGWRLTKEGAAVQIYEQSTADKPQSAAFVAAAMLAPLSELPDCDQEIYRMGMDSLNQWSSWLDELSVPHGLEGSVVVAHGHDASLLGKFERTLERSGVSTFRRLDRADIDLLEPELATSFQHGIFLEREGWLDNRVLLDRLEDECGSIVYGERVDPQHLSADFVVDCRGIGSDDPELRGVRGEVIRVRAPEVATTRPIRLMHPRYQLYISPRPNSEFVIGATEIESSSSSGVTVRSALELLSAAFTVHSGFAEAEITEMRSALRPAYPDNRPRVQWREGVLSINGLYRHGFLIAPAVIQAALREMESVWA